MIFLETRRLILRNVAPRDAAAIYDYRNSEVCARYQRGQTKTRSGIDALVQRRRNDLLSLDAPALLAIALKETDELVGEVVVMPQDGTISLGYTVSYLHHRKGYAFEALSALLAMLHERFPSQDFVCFTDPRILSASPTRKTGPAWRFCKNWGIRTWAMRPRFTPECSANGSGPTPGPNSGRPRGSIHPTAPARLEGGTPAPLYQASSMQKPRGRKAAGFFAPKLVRIS